MGVVWIQIQTGNIIETKSVTLFVEYKALDSKLVGVSEEPCASFEVASRRNGRRTIIRITTESIS